MSIVKLTEKPVASALTGNERLIVEQAGALKRLPVSILPSGGGDTPGRGIVSIELTGTDGEAYTFTVTYTDDTTSTFQIPKTPDGGSGVTSINGQIGKVTIPILGFGECASDAAVRDKVITGVDASFLLVDGTTLTVRFTAANTASSPRLTVNGETYIIYDWRTSQPLRPEDLGACTHHFVWFAGAWVLLNPVAAEGSGTPGEKGEDGKSAYALAVEVGFTGTLQEWLASLNGADGLGIVEVNRTSGDGSAGTVDTYTITYTDGTTSTFTVRNGSNGINGKDGAPGPQGPPGAAVQIDDSLTQQGQAADSKVTGDAIKKLREFLQGDVELTNLNLTSGLTTDADINVDFGGNRLRGVNDPVEDTDAASKGYVDEQIANISNDGNAAPSAGVCTTAANVAAKVEQGYIKSPIVGGSIVTVEFTNDNTANNPTLKVNGVVGAIVGRSMSAIDPASLTNGIHQFVCLENYNAWMMLDALEWEIITDDTLQEMSTYIFQGAGAAKKYRKIVIDIVCPKQSANVNSGTAKIFGNTAATYFVNIAVNGANYRKTTIAMDIISPRVAVFSRSCVSTNATDGMNPTTSAITDSHMITTASIDPENVLLQIPVELPVETRIRILGVRK